METGIKSEEARELAAMYRSQLSDIMEEWAKHTVDPTGGYITDLARIGNWFPGVRIYGLKHAKRICLLPIMNILVMRISGFHWLSWDVIFWFTMHTPERADGIMRCRKMEDG